MPNATGHHIQWAVMWAVPHNGSFRIVEKWCDNDLTEALRIHGMATRAGKQGVTLRSCNVGFPPPEKYREIHYVWVGSGNNRKSVPRLRHMERLNNKGVWWCPYCMKFRKFQKQDGFIYEGVYVPDSIRGEKQGMYCPMCGVSHRDFHVRRWNPNAQKLYLSIRRVRRARGKSTNRRRRRG